MKSYQAILMNELQTRRQKNQRFSLRAFAHFLDMSPAHLSCLINGKKNLTSKQAKKIIAKLNLSESENQALIQDIAGLQTKSYQIPTLEVLSDDEFKLISDWYHIAILHLSQLPNRAHARWIADQLEIDPAEAWDAFYRLQRLGLIKVNRGKFSPTRKNLTTKQDVPSKAVRKYQTQILSLAAEKLENVPVDKRDFSSITMSIHPGKLAKAKKMIHEFRQKLCAELESTPNPSEVYTLSIQLFPVTKARKKS
jgi:uncharacterized protein (TIGR02147 family)